ncbi:MAG: FAD-dependent oxidoreductase, partial [Pirellulaceae bacterium]
GRRRAAGIDPKKLPGQVADDDEAQKQGAWSKSNSIGGFVGSGYLHDGNAQKGELSATYQFEIEVPGTYDVRVAYTANPNRATNVPIVIHHVGGETKAMLDEKAAPKIDKMFHSLGRHRFEREATVVISNAGTNGYVVIDAVQLLPVK